MAGEPASDVIANVDVKAIVSEVVSRSDYQPGGYITFRMYCNNENGSDLSVRANNDFAMTWELVVDYRRTTKISRPASTS